MIAEAAKEGMIYTIGHSTHQIENFVSLLKRRRINAIADVRSVPYSRRYPQFNREVLRETLNVNGIAYVFPGKELGGRSDDEDCYENGQVKYRLLAKTPLFRSGIERVQAGSSRKNIALMCAEIDPLNCHRAILVARELVDAGAHIAHILANGQTEPHSVTMTRLIKRLGLFEQDMFHTAEEMKEHAYTIQEQHIAYIDKDRVREAQQVQ